MSRTSSTRRILAALTGAAVLCLSMKAPAATMAEIEALRLFDADFTTLHHATAPDAQFTKGSPRAKIVQEPRPTFDIEPTESICHGLKVGEDCASLRYETKGNLAPESGAIEVVFENPEWLADQLGVHILAQCLCPQSTLYIYKHSNDGCGVYLGNSKPKWSCFPRVFPKDLTRLGRHHIVFNYSPTEVSLFFDGKFIREYKPAGAFSGWGKYIYIGPSGKFGRARHSTVCRFTTYSRPLQGAEVRLLTASRIPTLKLADIPVIDKEIMPPSRLLTQTERLGLESLAPDWVPAPFIPVTQNGPKFQLWNRVYDFSGDALLQNVTSSGKQLLDAPAAIVGTLRGAPFTLKFAPVAKLDTDGKGRKVFTRAVTAPSGVTGTVVTTLEYDGAVRFDFHLKGLAADFLQLRVPLAKDFSDSVHYTGIPGAKSRSIVAPDNSYSYLLPADKNGELIARPFCSHFWLGSSRGGIELYHNSDRAFWPKDREVCFAVERAPGKNAELVARYVPAGTSVPAGGLDEFTVGLIATPVRPMPKGWRAWTISAQYDSFVGDTRGKLLVYWPDGWKSRISLDPDPERARDKTVTPKTVAADHATGRKVIPYWNHRHVGIRLNNVVSPDTDYLRANFQPHPARPDSGGAREYVTVHSATGYTDYLMRCVAAWGRVFGPVDGVYIDEMENIPNDDARTGGGYDMPDGKRRATYSTLTDRDMYKRLDAVVRTQNGGVPPSSIAHASGTMMMELLSHFPVVLTGEHLYSGYFPKRKDLLPPENDRLYYYSYSLPMDRVRTEFYHQPWGIVLAFLPCLKNQRDIMELPVPTRDLLSRIMHADMLYWPLWCNKQEFYKVERWRREFDIGNDAVEFIPYWENQTITATAPDACISFYKKNREYLVIVSNLGRNPATFQVTLPAGVIAARNAETDAAIPLVDGKITVSIPRNDFIPIRLF